MWLLVVMIYGAPSSRKKFKACCEGAGGHRVARMAASGVAP